MNRARLIALLSLYGAVLVDEASPTNEPVDLDELTGRNAITRLVTADLEAPTFIERDIPTASGQYRKTRNVSRWKQ